MTAPRFPIFITLAGERVLVVGGGKVAARRVGVLIEFGAAVTLVSPEICAAMRLHELAEWRQSRYDGLNGRYALVVAATDERETNRTVGEDARRAGIPVSVADARDESTFWFPAIVREGGIVAGLTSECADHSAVKRAAEMVREALGIRN